MTVFYSASAFGQVVDPMEVMEITPAEGSVTSLQNFTITFAGLPVVVDETAIPTLQKGGGATVEGHMRAGDDGKTVLVSFDESFTASGHYFLSLPDASMTVNGKRMLPLTLRFNIEGTIDSFYEQITIDPIEGEVESLQNFTISLPEYVTEITGSGRATLTNTTTGKSYNTWLNDVGFKVLAYFQKKVTEPGEYVLTIPAGTISIYSLGQDVDELTFNYLIPGDPTPPFYEQVTIDPAPGTVDRMKEFTITFPEAVDGIAPGHEATLTNTTTGTTCQGTLSAADTTVLITLAEEVTAPGRYTLTIPAGTIIINALGEEVIELKYNYVIPEGEMPAYTINPPEGEVYRLQYFTIAYGQKVVVNEEVRPVLVNDDTGDTYECNLIEIGGNAVVYMEYPTSVLGNYTLMIPDRCITIEATGHTNPFMSFHYTIVEKETFVPTVIEEQPEGELRLYKRTGKVVREVEKQYTVEEGESPYEIIHEDQTGTMNVVFGDDNKVYFQRPVSWSYYDGWVEGYMEADGKTIVVPMGQYVAYTKSLEMAVQVGMFYYDEDLNTYVYDESIEAMVYTLNADGSITQEDANPYIVLGTMNRAFGQQFQYLDYEWLQTGDYESVYVPMQETPIAPPAGLQTEPYYLTTANYDGVEWEPFTTTARVGFDGDDVWIRGISKYLPSAWIKGTRDGNTVTFDEPQLLGAYEVLLYFKAAQVDLFNGTTNVGDMVMTIDDNGTLTTYDYVFITSDKDNLYYINYYQGLTLSKQADTKVVAPRNLRSKEYYFVYQTALDANQPLVTDTAIVRLGFDGDDVYIKGLWNIMPEEWVKGRIVDGKLVMDLPQYLGKYTEEYMGTYPMYLVGFDDQTGEIYTQVTLDYNEQAGSFSNPDHPFCISINKTGYLSVQDLYDAVLTPMNTGAVDEVSIDGRTGAAEHYDLQGRRINDINSYNGIVITRNGDGTVTKWISR